MNRPNVYRRLIITTVLILIITIVIVIIIFANNIKQNMPESVAKDVLTRTYGVTLQDYENITNALKQSTGDNNALLNYLHSVYGKELTENGYQIFINNRIPTIAPNTAHKENSDLKVTSIDLEARDALEGDKRYAFTITVQTVQNESKTFTYKGNIILIREKGRWKVAGLSPVLD